MLLSVKLRLQLEKKKKKKRKRQFDQIIWNNLAFIFVWLFCCLFIFWWIKECNRLLLHMISAFCQWSFWVWLVEKYNTDNLRKQTKNQILEEVKKNWKKRLYQKKKYNYIKPKKQLSVLLYCYYVYYTVGWNSKNSEIICWNLLWQIEIYHINLQNPQI